MPQLQSKCVGCTGHITCGSTGEGFTSKLIQVVGRIHLLLVLKLKISISCWLLAGDPSQLPKATCSSLTHEVFLPQSHQQRGTPVWQVLQSYMTYSHNHVCIITYILSLLPQMQVKVPIYTQGEGIIQGHEYIYIYTFIPVSIPIPISISIYIYTEGHTCEYMYMHIIHI